MQNKLFRIHGGVHLKPHKDTSTTHRSIVKKIAIPAELVIPLQQNIGVKPAVLVKVNDYVFKGQTLAAPKAGISAAIHASSSGTVSAIEKRLVPHTSNLSCICIVITTDGKADWGKHQLPALTHYQTLHADILRQRIQQAGIVGLGGATFPTVIKLTPSNKTSTNILVINGAECEPYITCDDVLMQHKDHQIMQGICIMQYILQAKQCLIGIEDNKPAAIMQMKIALKKHPNKNITIVPVPTIYPTGGEKQLIKILTGKEVPSRGKPIDIGIVCHNVATSYSIYHAVILGKPLLSRYVTVTGEGIKQPQNVDALIGTSIETLVQASDGYTPQAKHLLMGGPMMGVRLKTDQIPVVKGMNCILVTDNIHFSQNTATMPCIRCGKCSEACPVNLLPQQLYWYAKAKNFNRIEEHHLFDCGCCNYVCPSHIPLVDYFRFAKTEIRSQHFETQKADIARQRHEFRDLDFRVSFSQNINGSAT